MLRFTNLAIFESDEIDDFDMDKEGGEFMVDRSCQLCFEKVANVFLSCGCTYMCEQCLYKFDNTVCPWCKQEIHGHTISRF